MTRLDLALSAGFFGILAVAYGGLAGAESTRHYLGLAFLVVAFLIGVGNTIELKQKAVDVPFRMVGRLYWASLASVIIGWLVGYALGVTPMND